MSAGLGLVPPSAPLVGSDRFKEGFFRGPPGIKAFMNEVPVDSESFGQVWEAFVDSVNGEKLGGCLVPLLTISVRPLAIFWLVITGCVFSVNGRVVRSFTHVVQKVFKGGPPFANGYSFSSIVLVLLCLWVKTPGAHGSPCAVRGGDFLSDLYVSTPSSLQPFCHFFPSVAPAGNCKTPKKGCVTSFGFFSAIAPAFRITNRGGFTGLSKVATRVGFFKNEKPSKTTADKGCSFRHGIGGSMLCSAVGAGRNGPSLAAKLNTWN